MTSSWVSSPGSWLRIGIVSAGLLWGGAVHAVAAAPPLRGTPIAPPAKTTTTMPTNTALLPDGVSLDAPDEMENGAVKLTFSRLANFRYEPPPLVLLDPLNALDPQAPTPRTNSIPAPIRAYDGRTVALTGYVLPVRSVGKKATELLLLRDSATCCFGASPQYNHFARVKMAPGEGLDMNDLRGVPVTIHGRLRVEERYEHGVFSGLYHLEGDRAWRAP